jgi:hypothetical protein
MANQKLNSSAEPSEEITGNNHEQDIDGSRNDVIRFSVASAINGSPANTRFNSSARHIRGGSEPSPSMRRLFGIDASFASSAKMPLSSTILQACCHHDI